MPSLAHDFDLPGESPVGQFLFNFVCGLFIVLNLLDLGHEYILLGSPEALDVEQDCHFIDIFSDIIVRLLEHRLRAAGSVNIQLTLVSEKETF